MRFADRILDARKDKPRPGHPSGWKRLYRMHTRIRVLSSHVMVQVCFKGNGQRGASRIGNFIIGASGSDKQMLCASSGARAALNIAAEKK